MVQLTLFQASVNTWEIRNYKTPSKFTVVATQQVFSEKDAKNWAKAFVSSWSSWSIKEVVSLESQKQVEDQVALLKKQVVQEVENREKPLFPLKNNLKKIKTSL